MSSDKPPGAGASASAGPIEWPPSFPAGAYTPHGYIDNPHHSMVLSRSGVLRSVPPLGMGYWRRTFRGAYGNGPRAAVNYLSLLQLSAAWGDVRLVTADDFGARGVELVSRYHTKHVLSYDWQLGPLTFRVAYFLPREHTLACHVEVASSAAADEEVRLHASHIYGLWEAPWWGSNGVGMRYLAAEDAAVSAIWAYGDYFALGADGRSEARAATADRAEWQRWLRAGGPDGAATATVRGPGPLHSVLSYRLRVPARGRSTLLVCLSRGPNEPAALAELRAGLAGARPALAGQLALDEAFWARCPQLAGDWPEAWQHGWVYDWETLRMNVRPPAGIFRHPWDAMQVHSPRSVLGEASVDMFALSHADPALAREVLLGTFADAPQPNVPCCREDGSMNMIAADGEACGTAPSWCIPFHVLRAIYAATGDAAWVTALYPHLAAYLDWWLAHRADEHGWLHCHCDWESGQDGSKRFPEAEGAAADTVRTVDVEASMAEALAVMALFARVAGRPADAPRWAALAEHRAAATRAMFVDGWYRDWDTRTNRPILLPDYVDAMMLAPLTCGIATPEQIAAVRPRFQYFRDHPRGWLEWPSFFLAYTEAAWTAGLRILAAEATADIADRIYPRTDARHVLFADPADPYAYRVPGVACEYWPLGGDTEPGGENYGWGATLPLHIIRSIVGLRETAVLPDGPAIELHLAPALPARLMVPGRCYAVRNLHFRGLDLHVRYRVRGPAALAVTFDYAALGPPAATQGPLAASVVDEGGRPVAAAAERSARGTLRFDATNGAVYTLHLEP